MNVNSPTELGVLIRDARRRREISQSQLAEEVGVSQQWLSNLERGQIDGAAIGTVFRLLAHLGLGLLAQERGTGAPSRRPSLRELTGRGG